MLRELYLDSNDLTELPGTLPMFMTLEVLSLNSNRLAKITSLKSFPKLRTLKLGNNMITSLEGISAGNLSKTLETFSISHNFLKKLTDLAELSGLKALKVLDIRSNPFTESQKNEKSHESLYFIIHCCERIERVNGASVTAAQREQAVQWREDSVKGAACVRLIATVQSLSRERAGMRLKEGSLRKKSQKGAEEEESVGDLVDFIDHYQETEAVIAKVAAASQPIPPDPRSQGVAVESLQLPVQGASPAVTSLQSAATPSSKSRLLSMSEQDLASKMEMRRQRIHQLREAKDLKTASSLKRKPVTATPAVASAAGSKSSSKTKVVAVSLASPDFQRQPPRRPATEGSPESLEPLTARLAALSLFRPVTFAPPPSTPPSALRAMAGGGGDHGGQGGSTLDLSTPPSSRPSHPSPQSLLKDQIRYLRLVDRWETKPLSEARYGQLSGPLPQPPPLTAAAAQTATVSSSSSPAAVSSSSNVNVNVNANSSSSSSIHSPGTVHTSLSPSASIQWMDEAETNALFEQAKAFMAEMLQTRPG